MSDKIQRAVKRLEKLLAEEKAPLYQKFYSSSDVRTYLRGKFHALDHEQFIILYLNNQHALIETKVEAVGTIDQAAVYPREVIKSALAIGANAVILAHNHPSGESEPSHADIEITRRLKAALDLINIRVLDHLIIGHDSITSLSERGLI